MSTASKTSNCPPVFIPASADTLCIDIGNSNVVLALFKGHKLMDQQRLVTKPDASMDFYRQQLFDYWHNTQKLLSGKIAKIALASVVPSLNPLFKNLLLELTGEECYLIDSTNLPMAAILVDSPQKVGIDRLINVYAAFKRYQQPVIVVDLGTATTFDVGDGHGCFLGGAIAPGLKISYETLIERTAQLPPITLEPPPSVIAKNTVHALQSGVLLGYVAMVEGMIHRMQEELSKNAVIIATGGLSTLIVPLTKKLQIVWPSITLEGMLWMAWERS